MITLRTSYSLRLGEHPAKKFTYALGFNCFCKSRRNLFILAAIISDFFRIFSLKPFLTKRHKFLEQANRNTVASLLRAANQRLTTKCFYYHIHPTDELKVLSNWLKRTAVCWFEERFSLKRDTLQRHSCAACFLPDIWCFEVHYNVLLKNR